jgi:SAM-dependent methyltransferase
MLAERFKHDGKAILPLNPLQQQMRDIVQAKVNDGRYALEVVCCPICQTNDLEPLAEKDRYGLAMLVAICPTCGLIQTTPRMTQEAYASFYNLEYRKLYGGYAHPNLHLFYDQYCRGQRLLNHILPHLSKEPSDSLVCEVGCGPGGILFAFREVGFTVKGLDLGVEYLEYGRTQAGLDLTPGSLADVPFSRKPDIILYSHVLEHILDLDRELAIIKGTLAEGGLVCIDVPGVKNIHHVYAGDFLRYLQNAHTYHFTRTTLMNLFVRNGFECVSSDEHVLALFRVSRDAAVQTVENDYDGAMAYLRQLELPRELEQRKQAYWSDVPEPRMLLAPDWSATREDWASALGAILHNPLLLADLSVVITLPYSLLDTPPDELSALANTAACDITAIPEPATDLDWLALMAGASAFVATPGHPKARSAANLLNTRQLEMADCGQMLAQLESIAAEGKE